MSLCLLMPSVLCIDGFGELGELIIILGDGKYVVFRFPIRRVCRTD